VFVFVMFFLRTYIVFAYFKQRPGYRFTKALTQNLK